MAPRVLNFLKRQMYWECDEKGASETFPYGVKFHLSSNHTTAKALNPFMLHNLDRTDLDLNLNPLESPSSLEVSPTVRNALRIWSRAVNDYTEKNSADYKNLTNPADKLVAISAIMRELQPYMNCAYLAGHWETDLICQLGWSAQRNSTRPTTYRAPSWSWASVDTCVSYFGRMYDTLLSIQKHFYPLAEVLSVNVEPLTEDTMGQVKSGELILKGHILDLEVKSFRRNCGSLMFHGEPTRLSAKLDDDTSPRLAPCSIKCVPIGVSFTPIPFLDKDPSWYLTSIIVEQTGTEGVYTRVGFAGGGAEFDAKQCFLSDPVLQTLETFDWSKEGVPEFSLNTEGMQVLRII